MFFFSVILLASPKPSGNICSPAVGPHESTKKFCDIVDLEMEGGGERMGKKCKPFIGELFMELNPDFQSLEAEFISCISYHCVRSIARLLSAPPAFWGQAAALSLTSTRAQRHYGIYLISCSLHQAPAVSSGLLY